MMLLLCLALTGCGDGGNGGGTSGGQTRTQRDAQMRALTAEMIECLRRNGVPDLPDATFDSAGNPQAPGPQWDPANNPQVATALQGPCKPILERVEALAKAPPEEPPAMSAEDLAKVGEYAKCMREHGLPDFPDADNTGRFRMPASWPEGLGKGDRPMDRIFLDAMKACEPLAVPGMAFG